MLVTTLPGWNLWQQKTLEIVQSHHHSFPLRRGIPREELKSRLKLSARVFNAWVSSLITRGSLVEARGLLAMPGHEVRFDSGQQARVQILKRKFEQSPFSPPGVKESQTEVGEDALLEQGEYVLVAADVIFRKEDYDFAVQQIRDRLTRQGTLTLAEVRDLFQTSRKYAQALLEHLDTAGVTVRDGDHRKLRTK
jgi:selenocysteine-specific elongation factor